MRILWLVFLVFAAVAHAQQPPEMVGTWKARMIVDQAGLAKQSKDFQKLMQAQIDRFKKKPWTLTLRKDGTYLLPLDHGQSEEGIWASQNGRLHLRTKKESGKVVAQERVDKFDVAEDKKSFRMKLTPYMTVEYGKAK